MRINKIPAPGWIGGFEKSNPAFLYPNPNLSSLPVLDNMANIDKLQRQQKVLWPEFSWETIPGQADSRCYQMFSPDISRLGYTDEGRVYSIICPQQGVCAMHLGCMNVEVTVTGQRGCANETVGNEKEPSTGFKVRPIAADMSVEGTIWFSPMALKNNLINKLWKHFKLNDWPFPFSKAHAIKVKTSLMGNPEQPLFPLVKGQTTRFPVPAFAQHEDEAWNVANLDVEIGAVTQTGHHIVDAFNQLVLDVFNLASGNMLKENNVLSWNVWFAAPELVNQEEWGAHARVWRFSIDTGHGSPTGPGTDPRYYDGTPYESFHLLQSLEEKGLPVQYKHLLKKGGSVYEHEKGLVLKFIEKHIEGEVKKELMTHLL